MGITTLGVNEHNDLFLYDGSNLQLLTGEPAVQQGVNQATSQRLTENPFNVNEGVDYLGAIFTPTPDYNIARDDLSRAALSVPDTLSVIEITLDVQGDKLLFNMVVLSAYGPTALLGELK